MIKVVVNRQSVAILFMVAIISYVYSVFQSGVYCRLNYFVHMYLGTQVVTKCKLQGEIEYTRIWSRAEGAIPNAANTLATTSIEKRPGCQVTETMPRTAHWSRNACDEMKKQAAY